MTHRDQYKNLPIPIHSYLDICELISIDTPTDTSTIYKHLYLFELIPNFFFNIKYKFLINQFKELNKNVECY